MQELLITQKGEISPPDKLCILGYGLLQLIIPIKWKERNSRSTWARKKKKVKNFIYLKKP